MFDAFNFFWTLLNVVCLGGCIIGGIALLRFLIKNGNHSDCSGFNKETSTGEANG